MDPDKSTIININEADALGYNLEIVLEMMISANYQFPLEVNMESVIILT